MGLSECQYRNLWHDEIVLYLGGVVERLYSAVGPWLCFNLPRGMSKQDRKPRR